MPRIILTDQEYQTLMAGDADQGANEMDEAEYLARRDSLIEKFGDDEEKVDALLERFPHPAEAAERERQALAKENLEAEIAERRPTTPEKQEAFFRDLDAVPDGDKEMVRKLLAKYGMYSEDEALG